MTEAFFCYAMCSTALFLFCVSIEVAREGITWFLVPAGMLFHVWVYFLVRFICWSIATPTPLVSR